MKSKVVFLTLIFATFQKINNRKENGSMMLEAAITLFAGIVFSLGVVNVGKYVLATNAVEQAARSTARCLTPTDPECVRLAANKSATQQNDWFFIQSPSVIDQFANYYTYSANLVEETWTTKYNRYEISKVSPQLKVESHTIPVGNYAAVSNSYEQREALIAVTAKRTDTLYWYVPKSANQNNLFAGSYNQDKLTIEDRGDWLSHLNNQSLAFKGANLSAQAFSQGFVAMQTPEAGIVKTQYDLGSSSSGYREYQFIGVKSDYIQVPELSANVDCKSGSSCGVSANFKEDVDFHNRAYVAIKAFAFVTPKEAAKPAIQWGSGKEMPGLMIEILGKNGLPDPRYKIDSRANFSAYKTDEGYCLGGATGVNSTSSGATSNLWLRGPSGSNGGTSPICNCDAAGNCGRVGHTALSIERGGKFRIHGYLGVKGAAANVTIGIYYYLEDYTKESQKKTTVKTQNCTKPWFPVNTNGNVVVTTSKISMRDCGFSDSAWKYVEWTDHSRGAKKWTPQCEKPNSKYKQQVVAAFKYRDTTSGVVACPSDNFLELSTLPAPTRDPGENKIWCGWELANTAVSNVEIGHADSFASCAGNKKTTTYEVCGNSFDYTRSGNYGEISTTICPQSAALVSNSKITNPPSYNDVQGNQYQLSPKKVSWAGNDKLAAQWRINSWTPAGVEATTRVEKKANLVRFKKEQQEAPVISAFSLESINGQLPPSGWQDYSVPVLSQQKDVAIKGFPFTDEAIMELPRYGYNEEQCETINYEYSADVQNAMREYAAANNPLAAKKEGYYFEAVALFAGERQIAPSSYFSAPTKADLGVPSCIPIDEKKRQGLEEAPQYIGRFDATEEEPRLCADADKKCFSTPVNSYQLTVGDESYNYGLAKERGLDEIKRTFGETVKVGCDQSGCAQIDVNNEGLMTQVKVKYNLPLSFPLDLVLGSDHVEVVTVKEEASELALIASRIAE
ncbi:MAG: pilus assembly protein [Deltaproteobacteria bacterium]|nr:pilus assembly protein [Deltaproteobacteria bacterium]